MGTAHSHGRTTQSRFPHIVKVRLGLEKAKTEGYEDMQKENLTEITGTVETVVYKNEETGFSVLELDRDGELLTVVGELSTVGEGEVLTLLGNFRTHPNYGTQFKAVAAQQKLPASASAILRYLSSGVIKGIGPVLASRMVTQFGDDTLKVLENEPERLSEVQGISPAKCEKLKEELGRMFGMRSVMLFLSQFGINSSTSVSIWKRWGTMAQRMIEENPYLLCSEDIGMDFEQCEAIAIKLKIPPDSSYRIEAAIQFVLRHNLFNGHTCLPMDKLLPAAAGLISQSQIMLEKGMEALLHRRELVTVDVNGRTYCYLPEYLEAEHFITSRIQFMLMADSEKKPEIKDKIDALEQRSGIAYASLQKYAIEQAMYHKIFILTGGPGTGKTTTINAIIELLEESGCKVALCAPTGRAAKRMSEVTGKEAKTIHRLLEVDFADPSSLHFKRNEKNPLPHDAVIVDETSMVDVPLMRSLIGALKMNCRLILVGDSDQLPSVGPGNVLRDLIASQKVPQVRLTEIFRQAQQSLIVTNAHAIVHGKMPELKKHDNDFFFLKRERADQIKATTLDLVSKRLPKSYGYSPLHDIQVIVPTRIGAVGANTLNQSLQEVLNPPSEQKPEFESNGRKFRKGDKVMQIKNNYDILWKRDNGEEGMGVYNGDIGFIENIDRPSKTLMIRFDDRIAEYLFEMAPELELAYAITVHKSQGSEFDAVVMPLASYKSKMHYRNLLYTAVTRAKNMLIILGQEKTIAEMIANDRKTVRYTNLMEMLLDEVEE